MMIEMIRRFRELERNQALPPITLIDLDRWIRALLFETSDAEHIAAQDYYIATLRRTA